MTTRRYRGLDVKTGCAAQLPDVTVASVTPHQRLGSDYPSLTPEEFEAGLEPIPDHVLARLPVTDAEIKHAAQFSPGSVFPAAQVIPAVPTAPDAYCATPGAGNGRLPGMRIAFFVPCVPVAQPRQRHRIVKTTDGRTFTQNFTPARHPVQDFKATVRMAWELACYEAERRYVAAWPHQVAVRLTIDAVFPRPKSMTRKRGPNPREPKTGKPDVDNVAKSVLDALNGLAWADDSAVACLTVRKWIAAANESARVDVVIEEIPT